MNYKSLLEKYIQHVVECEGIDFIDHIGQYSDSVKFTDEDVEALEQIRDELYY